VLRAGSFGNLVEEKGVLLLVEACAGIRNLELHLAGRFLDPAFESRVRDRARELGVALTCHGAYRADAPHPAR
jgi:glycosyltransferase involved in cell wall biosynthesis